MSAIGSLHASDRPIRALVEVGGEVLRLSPAEESGKLLIERVRDGDRVVIALPEGAGAIADVAAAPWIDCGLVAVMRAQKADGTGSAYYWLIQHATVDTIDRDPLQKVFAEPAVGRIDVPADRFDLFGVRTTAGDSICVVLGRHTRGSQDDYRFEGYVWINNCPVSGSVPGVLHRIQSPPATEDKSGSAGPEGTGATGKK